MGTKLSPTDEELYRRVDEILHYVWDPIGISGIPEARDEHHSYLQSVFGHLKSGSTAEVIASLLHEISTGRMGLNGNRKRDLEVAQILLNWKDAIQERNG